MGVLHGVSRSRLCIDWWQPAGHGRYPDRHAPDPLAKVRSLAQILQQGLKERKISEAEIQQRLTSGQLGEKLKQLSPEAPQLLEEISDASRQGKGPGAESLMPLKGGLGIAPN